MKPAREEKNIKVLFKGVSKDNPHKAIVEVQVEEGVLRQQINGSYEIFEKNGADISTAVPSLWA